MSHPSDLAKTKWLMTILLCLIPGLLGACRSGGTNPASTPTLRAALPPTGSQTAPTFATPSPAATLAPATLAVPTSPPSAVRASPTATLTEAPTIEPAVQPNPLNVSAQVDASRAVSATISNSGGTLSATAADGTRFTLTVPRDALLLDEIITLTPVRALDGLPLGGGLSAAVQIDPEDLQFAEPATLTIQPTKAEDAQSPVGFAYHGQGDEFHLYLAWASGATVNVPLMHSGGYGMGKGSADDIGAHTPTATEDWAEQEIARVVKNTFDPSTGLTGDANKQVEAILVRWYDRGVSPGLTDESDDDAFLNALWEFNASLSMANLLLGPDGAQQFAQKRGVNPDQATDMVARRIPKGSSKCQKGGFDEALQMLAMYSHAAAMNKRGARGNLAGLRDVVRKCARFKLNFASSVNGFTPRGTQVITKVHLQDYVTINLDDTLTRFAGSGTLSYVEFKINPNPPNKKCTPWTYMPVGSTFRVVSLVFVRGSKQDPIRDFDVLIDPGNPEEVADTYCEGHGIPYESHVWKDGFIAFHPNGSQAGLHVRDWRILSGGALALSNLGYQAHKFVDGREVDEDTALELTHTPTQ